jgi:hypothetical protein
MLGRMRRVQDPTLRVPCMREIAAPGLAAAAIALAVLYRGGFTLGGLVGFVLLAALAAIAAVWADGLPAWRAMRHPFVAVLLAIATLSALSSLWTVGRIENALEAALLPAGYALLAAAVLGASARHRARVQNTVLAAICTCAFVSGVVGLLAAATFSVPQAFSPNGVWRPAGTLEYTTALTLLEVCALPALLLALAGGGRLARLASAPAVVAGAVIGLSASRLGIAMALAVALVTIAAPRLTVRTDRKRALLAVGFMAVAAAAARAALGGSVAPGADAPAWRVAVVIGLLAGAPLVWIALEAGARRSARAALAFAAAALIAFAVISPPADTAAATGSAPVVSPQTPGPGRAGRHDALHGRGNIWNAG